MQILKGHVTKGEVKDQQASSKTGRLTGPRELFSIHLHLLNRNSCLQKKTESQINEAMHKCVCGGEDTCKNSSCACFPSRWKLVAVKLIESLWAHTNISAQ